jgi:hypothetical protein
MELGDAIEGSSVTSTGTSWSMRTSVTSDNDTTRVFSMKIVESRRPPEVIGLEHLGFSPSCMRKYREPTTCNSSAFESFITDKCVGISHYLDIDTSLLLKEFRPPRIADFIQHLERFGSPRPVDKDVLYHNYAWLLGKVPLLEGIPQGQPRYRDWLSYQNALHVRVSRDTSPGIRWQRMGYKSKKEALPAALAEVDNVIRGLQGGNIPTYPPCVPAGRGKLVDVMTGTDAKQGRLILMPDLVQHIVGSCASIPYSKLVKETRKDDGGVMIGMGPFSSWYERLVGYTQKKKVKFFATLDFSGFDQTVPAMMLDTAMTHIATRFSECDGKVGYWVSETNELIRTPIALTDGEVYRKARGVASGNPWTSQAGSLAHWMMWLLYFRERGIDARAWIFGDDVLVAVTGGIEEEEFLADAKAWFYEKMGMEIKDSESYTSRQLVISGPYPVERASIKFLSAYFMTREDRIVPVPHSSSLITGLLYPERNPEVGDPQFHEKDNYDYEIARATSYYVLHCFNHQSRNVCEMYIEYLRGRRRSTDVTLDTTRLLAVLQELDIPPSLFAVEWVSRLPTDGELIELYLFGTLPRYLPGIGPCSDYGRDGDPGPWDRAMRSEPPLPESARPPGPWWGHATASYAGPESHPHLV